MKVVFISPDFGTIVELPKDYLISTNEFYQALIDFKYDRCLDCATTEHFLKHHGTYNMYVRDKDDVTLLHIGIVKTRYREAEKYFNCEMSLEEIENVYKYLNYWLT